jgi:hypothetical protein
MPALIPEIKTYLKPAMHTLLHLLARVAHLAFWYCCDFMVNLANLTHTSYYEANTWVLLLLLPGLLALLIGVRVAQRLRLRQLRGRSASRL